MCIERLKRIYHSADIYVSFAFSTVYTVSCNRIMRFQRAIYEKHVTEWVIWHFHAIYHESIPDYSQRHSLINNGGIIPLLCQRVIVCAVVTRFICETTYNSVSFRCKWIYINVRSSSWAYTLFRIYILCTKVIATQRYLNDILRAVSVCLIPWVHI